MFTFENCLSAEKFESSPKIFNIDAQRLFKFISKSENIKGLKSYFRQSSEYQ